MKKLISMILVLVLVLSMSMTAFAAEVPSGGTQSITATYSEVESAIVYKVDVSWGGMVFNYNSGMENVWNPDMLKFETVQKGEASWAPAAQGGDTVNVTKHSNASVGINITYTKAENGVDGTLENGSFTLGSSDNGVDGTAGTATSDSAKLTLSTANIPDSFKDGSTNVTIGSLTVSISYATGIDATNMTADELKSAVATQLAAGETDITVTLAPDAPAEMITAIRRVICDTEDLEDGSINLTLKGVTSIPDNNYDGIAFGMRNGEWDENDVEIVSEETVTQLASVNLPDVTYIGTLAFYSCENLASVTAPKVQTIGESAFDYTALTSVEFPELTTIPTFMFSGTSTLTSAKFPKVTTIEQGGLLIGWSFAPENNPTPFPLELTAEGDITFNGSYHFNIESQNYSGKVDLVLNVDKKDEVTFNDDGTATWKGYTFKSITFVD